MSSGCPQRVDRSVGTLIPVASTQTDTRGRDRASSRGCTVRALSVVFPGSDQPEGRLPTGLTTRCGCLPEGFPGEPLVNGETGCAPTFRCVTGRSGGRSGRWWPTFGDHPADAFEVFITSEGHRYLSPLPSPEVDLHPGVEMLGQELFEVVQAGRSLGRIAHVLD